MTLKREAWVTYGALVPDVAGVVIASGGEPGFHWFGFIMCISATAARAFKSVLQGILLSSEGEKLNSMVYVPYSCCCSSSGHAGYGTRRDQLDLDAC
ncbi:hypothetical protein YC2023_026387 [Brassica napus]